MSVTSSRGLSPRPSAAAWGSRSNGLAMTVIITRKIPETTNSTASAYPDSSRRSAAARRATSRTNSAWSHSQSRIEPSSAPQSPGDPVAQRARRHARVGDVPYAEVAGDQQILEDHDGETHEDELRHRRATRARERPGAALTARAHARGGAGGGDEESRQQGGGAKLGDSSHGCFAGVPALGAAASRAFASRSRCWALSRSGPGGETRTNRSSVATAPAWSCRASWTPALSQSAWA